MVEGHYLVVGADELGGQGALHALAHHAGPGAASKALGGVVDRLELALAHLKHERPVGALLRLLACCLCSIALHNPDIKIIDSSVIHCLHN